MKMHEYQAKELMARLGVPTPPGRVCATADEAAGFAASLGSPVVVKAQVHVGGRGKAGGVKLASDPSETRRIAGEMLGGTLKGLTIERVLVEEALDIREEYYLGITVDRAARRSVVMVSATGGIDIEEVAATAPERIAKGHIDPSIGLPDFQIRGLCYAAGISRDAVPGVSKLLGSLYEIYEAMDTSLVEINPAALTADGRVIAADAKMIVDDNALFRHPDLRDSMDTEQADPIEREARRLGIQYVRLDGEIGVIGNGAGLVMATLDEVRRAGGRGANFLDIGGGAKSEAVRDALRIVLMNPNVKGVLFNIFGGITRCDEVARGVLDAASLLDIRVPMVIRLAGTREEEGRALLSGSKLVSADTMQQAADIIVRRSGGGSHGLPPSPPRFL
jgi:succinyl-CoA synthetase beta subunit